MSALNPTNPMKHMLLATLTGAALLLPFADAGTFKRCINKKGCVVVETLASGNKVTHKLNQGDEFETGSGSYVWRGGSASWQNV